MDTDFRLKRHTEMWMEQNKWVKRAIIASLVFGMLLLTNVLRPYSVNLEKRRDVRNEIEIFIKEKEKIENAKKALNDFENNSEIVQKTIREQPWMKEKDKLIHTFAEINRRGEGNPQRYQQEADNTVRVIASQVDDKIVKPLNEFFFKGMASELMPELSAELKNLPVEIDVWIRQNLGKRWYSTLDEKERRVGSLTESLQRKLEAISSKIKLERPNLTRKAEELSKKIDTLEKESKIKEKEELLKELEARMEKILPEWIRGVISLEQMIQLYPFIIFGLVVYVLLIALSLSKHYQFMAQAQGFTKDVETDPILSSLWTLTYRGRFGTISTIVTYLGFVTAMWFLFEMGSEIFLKWLKMEGGGALTAKSLQIIRWFLRCIFMIIACFVVAQPIYRKNKLPLKVPSTSGE